MILTNEETTSRVSRLLEESKRYLLLQKDYLGLHATEILIKLFSTVALWAILILVGFTVLLFASFALAFWIGDLTGSSVLGFTVITVVLLMIVLLVYANRTSWIVIPTTRFIAGLLAESITNPTQEVISIEKEHIRQEAAKQQETMKASANTLLAPMTESRTKWEQASLLLQNGLSIYRGVQLGLSTVVALQRIFGRSKRK